MVKLKNDFRIRGLQGYLRKKKVAGCVIENPIDLLYLTGLRFSAATLIVTQFQARLFVDGRYIQMAKEEAPIPAVLMKDEKVCAFLEKQKIKQLTFDRQLTSYGRYLELKKWTSLKGVDLLLRSLRAIKDQGEVEALRHSSELLWKGFSEMRRGLKVGVTERGVAKIFELFCLKNGGDSLGFEPIVAFGAHSAMPHYHSDETPLRKGDTVLIDIGVVVNGYHSDMTRTLFFGKPKPKMKHVYEVVHAAQKAALACCKPGLKLGAMDEAARKVMRKEKLLSYYPHGLGHGVGLEVHEAPRLSYKGKDKDVLIEPGMVFTVEPGIYVLGLGGVRYEDTVIVTEDDFENLYPNWELSDAILSR